MALKIKPRIHNLPQNKELRRSLRKSLTFPERLLWSKLKNQTTNYKFRRQHGIGNYIADFYCPKTRVAVELDGHIHSIDEKMKYDEERDNFFKQNKITVLRYQNNVVIKDLEAVWQDIKNHCDELVNLP